MGSELAPSLVIPIDAPGVGSVGEPSVAFAGSPPALFVAEPILNPSWSKWIAWHAPDIAAIVLPLAIVVTAWMLLRIVRRVRRSGGLYCRACNHELALPQVRAAEDGRAVWAGDEAKCPECGKRDERGPVQGKQGRGKAIAVIAAGLVVCGACGWTLASTLRIRTSTVAKMSETWPVAGLERLMGSWSLSRRSLALSYQVTRFSRVDPLTGARDEIGMVDTATPRMFNFVTGDGKYVVATSSGTNALEVIEVGTKKRKEISFDAGGAGFRGYLMVVQFSQDLSHVFVNALGRKGTQRRDELFSVDLAAGAKQSIAVVEHEVEASPTKAGSYSQFLVAEVGADPVWVHQVSKRDASGRQEELTLRWDSGGERHERHEKAANELLIVRLGANGKVCVVEDVRDRKAWAFASADGRDVDDVPERVLSGRYLGRRLIVSPGPNGTGVVRDIGVMAMTRATLKTDSSSFPQFEQSVGDRFAAAIGGRDIERNRVSRMLGAPSLKGFEVRVWDLQPLLDQKFGEERPKPKSR